MCCKCDETLHYVALSHSGSESAFCPLYPHCICSLPLTHLVAISVPRNIQPTDNESWRNKKSESTTSKNIQPVTKTFPKRRAQN